jgi:hypothetical protein
MRNRESLAGVPEGSIGSLVRPCVEERLRAEAHLDTEGEPYQMIAVMWMLGICLAVAIMNLPATAPEKTRQPVESEV